MTRHGIWREAFADALRIEWAQVEALPALRCTVRRPVGRARPAASFVALQSAVAALVAGAYPADLRGAAVRALLVFAGGVAQIVLVVGLWPLRSFHRVARRPGQPSAAAAAAGAAPRSARRRPRSGGGCAAPRDAASPTCWSMS